MDLRIRIQKAAFDRCRQPFEALVSRAPAAESYLHKSLEGLSPVAIWLSNSRRRLATAGIALLTLWLFMHVMFGANGMVVYREKRSEYKSLRKEIDGLEHENDRYTQQIKALKNDPAAIEKEAREQLHYVRPGEVIYVAPAPPVVEAPISNSAKR